MSELRIWDRLAILDGLCEHQWEGKPHPYFSRAKRFTCLKCGFQSVGYKHEDLARVGDGWGQGRNEERYNSLDALFDLLERLKADDQRIDHWCIVSHELRSHHPQHDATIWVRAAEDDEGSWLQPFVGEDDDPCVALATAIVKAKEVE